MNPDETRDAQQIGERLTELRSSVGLSLVALGRVAAMSKSTLHRVETGQRLLTADEVIGVDTGVRAAGRLIALHQELEFRRTRVQTSAESWIHAFPASWAGPVWVHLEPTKSDATRQPCEFFTAELVWGSWRRSVRIPRLNNEICLLFGKGADGESIPLTMRAERCIATFGFGEPPVAGAVDINGGWEFIGDVAAAASRVGRSLAHMMKRSGTSIESLAQQMGVNPQDLRRVLQLEEH